ncbi:hypothetical protein V6N13_061181 [Hibiscus sabdariffa]
MRQLLLRRFWVFGLELHQYNSSLLRSAAACVLLLLPRICTTDVITVTADNIVVSLPLGSGLFSLTCVGGLWDVCSDLRLVFKWGLPIEDVLVGEVDWFRLASLIRWVDGRSGRWRSGGCLGREELGSNGKLKAKELDKGGGGELAAGGLGGVGGVGAKLAPASGVCAGPSVELAAAVGAWGYA